MKVGLFGSKLSDDKFTTHMGLGGKSNGLTVIPRIIAQLFSAGLLLITIHEATMTLSYLVGC